MRKLTIVSSSTPVDIAKEMNRIIELLRSINNQKTKQKPQLKLVK